MANRWGFILGTLTVWTMAGFPGKAQDSLKPRPSILDELKTAAEAGDLDAQWQLVSYLVCHDSLDTLKWRFSDGDKETYANLPIILKWTRSAAEKGNPSAQYYLSELLGLGFGDLIPRDEAMALKWMMKAAENGYLPSMEALGFKYTLGIYGGKPNLKEAEKWFRKAFMNGSEMAGRLLYKLRDLSPDADSEIVLLRLEAKDLRQAYSRAPRISRGTDPAHHRSIIRAFVAPQAVPFERRCLRFADAFGDERLRREAAAYGFQDMLPDLANIRRQAQKKRSEPPPPDEVPVIAPGELPKTNFITGKVETAEEVAKRKAEEAAAKAATEKREREKAEDAETAAKDRAAAERPVLEQSALANPLFSNAQDCDPCYINPIPQLAMAKLISRHNKIHGVVVLMVVIGTDGIPLKAIAIDGPYELRQACERGVESTRFQPVMVGKGSRVVKVKMTFVFRP